MRMIFHVPFELDPSSAFANDIRPLKMLQAFRSLGYEVDGVYGRNRERKLRAEAVQRKIQSGVEYSFVYSESSGVPTAFTDPSKKPTHPIFDLAFLRFCRSNGLKVGLFYRDVYWRFPNTVQYKSRFRHAVLPGFYLLDLLAYNFAISKIYLPSMAMHRFIPLTSRIDAAALPPAHDLVESKAAGMPQRQLNLLYVGGLGKLYDLHTLMGVVRDMPEVHFTLCTRPADWDREGSSYKELLADNITIVHEKGEGLKKLYADANVAVFFLKPTKYSEFAVSVKLFEYISYRLPTIAIKDTLVGSIVESENVGWTLPFDAQSLRGLLTKLRENPETIAALAPRLIEAGVKNTWTARARSVAEDLSC
jgi:hypothetical protein